MSRDPLTFAKFSEANRRRCLTAFNEPLDETSSWEPQDWALTMAEEVGEVAAAVQGMAGKKRSKKHLTKADVGDEIADVVCYADLLAARLGLDLAEILAAKFNRVSDRVGSDIKL